MTTSVQELGHPAARRLSMVRVGAATALSAMIFLLLCWIGAAIGVGPASHMAIQLISGFPVASAAALATGLCWSLVGGFLAGAIFAGVYNLLAIVER